MIAEIIAVTVLASIAAAIFILGLHRSRRNSRQVSTNNPGDTPVSGIDESGGYIVAHLPVNEAGSRSDSIDANSVAKAESDQVGVEPCTGMSENKAETAIVEASRGRTRRREGLRMIHGIGEKREGKLMNIGIRTIEELAEADPREIAAKLGISEKLTSAWVEEARMIVSRRDS
jgi:predicted flap endonuclease-1-like 5' DNA nuclease